MDLDWECSLTRLEGGEDATDRMWGVGSVGQDVVVGDVFAISVDAICY